MEKLKSDFFIYIKTPHYTPRPLKTCLSLLANSLFFFFNDKLKSEYKKKRKITFFHHNQSNTKELHFTALRTGVPRTADEQQEETIFQLHLTNIFLAMHCFSTEGSKDIGTTMFSGRNKIFHYINCNSWKN